MSEFTHDDECPRCNSVIIITENTNAKENTGMCLGCGYSYRTLDI